MEFTEEEKIIQELAKRYVEDHKDELIDRFILSKRPIRISALTFFMAGSPGAGKTEFVNYYFKIKLDKSDIELQGILKERNMDINEFDCFFVKIDVDEIRDFIPYYKKTNAETGQKGNANVIQSAANKGLDILRDFCFENDISFIHDGTFGNYDTMKKLIKKSISKNRLINIYYLYLDPLIAWEFTKAREFSEGRNIEKDKFISQFFDSQQNINKIKAMFGDKIKVHCILKDNDNKVVDIVLNQPNIANFMEIKYNNGLIKKYTKEDLSDLLR